MTFSRILSAEEFLAVSSVVVDLVNKAVIDRRLRPRCCHLGSYFKRPKSSPVRPVCWPATGITAHIL